MTERRAVIIGGGLAGMTVAKELLKRGMQAVILEASSRLGGKAGADYVNGVYVEHGYHIFPAWYENTRQLLRELKIEDNLRDIEKFHQLKKGQFKEGQPPHFNTLYQASSLRNLIRDIFSGVLPWPEMVLSLYFILDLCSQWFKGNDFFDRVSLIGFLRTRWYRTEDMAHFQQQTVLQASAIPSYEISVMVARKLARCWMRKPAPFVSILNGNLQEKFIDPFEKFIRSIKDGKLSIQLNRRVKKLEITDNKVSGVQFCDESTLEETGPEDIFVLATPPEVTVQFVDDGIYTAEQAKKNAPNNEKLLSDLAHLQTARMAGLQLYLKRCIPGLPREHVNLYGSRYKISLIDVSQHWENMGKTTLSLIASNFEPLRGLSEKEIKRCLIEELQEYIPAIRWQDIERCDLQSNLESPLFLNTVGAWHFRPGTKTRIDNLYVAGDYCRSEADLTTMESAVISGLSTARDILRSQGLESDVDLIRLKIPSITRLLLKKYIFLPAILLLRLWLWVRERLAK